MLRVRIAPCLHDAAFTIIEVMISAVLILISLGSILAMNAESMHALRATRQAAAGSQVLQQRIETIRTQVWPEVSNSTALARLMSAPTEAEKELSDAGFIETVRVWAAPPVGGAIDEERTYEVRRQRDTARVVKTGDLGSDMALLIESTIAWRDVQGAHERRLRTLVCRSGLTRSGIYGSALGRAGADSQGK